MEGNSDDLSTNIVFIRKWTNIKNDFLYSIPNLDIAVLYDKVFGINELVYLKPYSNALHEQHLAFRCSSFLTPNLSSSP